jgi:hypothetical protein
MQQSGKPANSPRKKPITSFSFFPEDTARIERIQLRFARFGHLLNRSEAVRVALLGIEDVDAATASDLLDRLERRRPGPIAASERKAK